MKENKKNMPESPMHQIDRAAMNGTEMSLEQVRSYLVQDVKGIYVLLSDILNTPEVVDALAKAIYKRYQKFIEAKKAAPELPLNGK